jgi:DNA topoisomerase VI subunit A
VITAKGQPDVATRLFLARLTKELKIPVLGLVDSDPYGLKILSVYMSGSKNMSYDSASLTTPNIQWLGLRPSDLDKYDLPEQCRLDMTENDIKTGHELMKEDFIMKNPKWMKELEIMVSWICMIGVMQYFLVVGDSSFDWFAQNRSRPRKRQRFRLYRLLAFNTLRKSTCHGS